MYTRWYRRFLMMFLILVTILGTGFSIKKEKAVSSDSISNTNVILGGMPAGIYMKTDGVLVLGTEKLTDMNGKQKEPAKNVVCEGDYIVGINGAKVETKNELVIKVARLDQEDTILDIRRDGKEMQVEIDAVEIEENRFKLGIWIKDSVQGLGTVTYLREDGSYGALGHGIYDTDNSSLLEIEDGRLYKTRILGITKGVKGEPGGIEGVIIYNTWNYLGTVEQNTNIGIYGKVQNVNTFVDEKIVVPIGKKKDVELGKATIFCTIEDVVESFEVEIEQIDYFPLEENKEMVIRITDEALLKRTGGIVQGMSGSPIIQDGKLVGAVTHVLVKDPTRGYGIFIENMLEAKE